MANDLKTAVLQRNEMLDAHKTNFNTGLLKLYTGTKPADADTALAGNTLLATLTLNATAFPASSGGVLTANAITSATAVATGTATFFRIRNAADSATLCDGTVGTSGCDMNLNTAAIVTSASGSISPFPLTLPA